MSCLDDLKKDIEKELTIRLINEVSENTQISILKKYPVNFYIDIIGELLYLNCREKDEVPALFNDFITVLGKAILKKLNIYGDEALAAKVGAFVTYTLENFNLVKVELIRFKKYKKVYIIKLLEVKLVRRWFKSLPKSEIEKWPLLNKPKDWISFKSNNIKLVKTPHDSSDFTLEKMPKVYKVVNKMQKKDWKINKAVLELAKVCLKNKEEAFNDIWLQNSIAKRSKFREAETLILFADTLKNTKFYHLYYLDFRGRIYTNTAYLHEQGCDLAKGLLLRNKGYKLTKAGYFWLCVQLMNYWAGDIGRKDGRKSDKIPLKERYEYVDNNTKIFVNYANNPLEYNEWMKADKPWQFIAMCFELRDYLENPEKHISYIQGYLDGSINGTQHLVALTKDDKNAASVNLIKQKYPGDLYAEVGTSVWQTLEEEVDDSAELLLDEYLELKQAIKTETRNDVKEGLIADLMEFKDLRKESLANIFRLFWLQIKELSHKRKICKRGVMTISYGATKYGMGNQIRDDAKKHGIPILDDLDMSLASFLGRELFKACEKVLTRPMQLLDIFRAAGVRFEKEEKYMSYKVPITNFPVIQEYQVGTYRKIWIQYGPPNGERGNSGYFDNTLQLRILFRSKPKMAKNKQALGAAPNIIHSLDAAHLMLTTLACDFEISSVHDSYGAHLNNLPQLYRIVREQFVVLYKTDPLNNLAEQLRLDLSDLELGDYDVEEIKRSEYAFS